MRGVMLRSGAKFVLLLLLLAAAGWLAWRPTSGRGERAGTPRPMAEVAQPSEVPPAELQLDAEPAQRVEAYRALDSAALEAPTESTATLSVQVVAKESGAPLAGIGLVLHEPRGSWSSKASAESRGGVGPLQTGAAGSAEYAVPAGVTFELRVNTQDAPAAGSAHRYVLALAPGERRELVVELVTALDLVWYGQIIDGESGAPLADARVERVVGDPFTRATGGTTAESAADGLMRLAFASWSTSFARVELEGYASGFVSLDGGHEQPSRALQVRLARAATLEMRATDPSGAPREGVDVRVSCKASELLERTPWMGFRFDPWRLEEHTDAQGRCVLAGLPPRTPLTLEVFAMGELLRREDALNLEPGERRELAWIVGGPCTLTGRTLESDGTPAAGVIVWLRTDDGFTLARDFEQGVTQTRSDEGGRFTLEVAAGTWLVGPAPAQSGARTADGPLPDIAPKAERVVIAPGQTSAEVTLICWRGLFLSGTVRGPGGEALPSVYVGAVGEGSVSGGTFDDGEFSIGPLPPGSYSLVASDSGLQGCADSEARIVGAGTEGIELVLRRGASVSVRVLDALGKPPPDTSLWIMPEAGAAEGFRMTATDGVFELANLVPGGFTVSAATPGDGFALARHVVIEEGDARELELRLAAAGQLRIEVLPRPEARMTAEIHLEGHPLAFVALSDTPRLALSEGDYEVVLMRSGGMKSEELQRQRVHVAAEGETRVVFDLAAPR